MKLTPSLVLAELEVGPGDRFATAGHGSLPRPGADRRVRLTVDAQAVASVGQATEPVARSEASALSQTVGSRQEDCEDVGRSSLRAGRRAGDRAVPGLGS